MTEFSDVRIRPTKSALKSRADVALTRFFPDLNWLGVPIIASNIDTIGTFLVADSMRRKGMITAISKYTPVEDWKAFSYAVHGDVAVTVGLREGDFEYLDAVMQAAFDVPRFILADVANGYLEVFLDLVHEVKDTYPNIPLIAGSVTTPEGVWDLIEAGADMVKVGIGTGSICITSDVTGIGAPRLESIQECADVAHYLGKYIVAEGGFESFGDVAKAFVAGADFIMTGRLLSGHDETGDDYYGMASERAQILHYGKVANYRSVEGAETAVIPWQGELSTTLLQRHRMIQIRLQLQYTYQDNEPRLRILE